MRSRVASNEKSSSEELSIECQIANTLSMRLQPIATVLDIKNRQLSKNY